MLQATGPGGQEFFNIIIKYYLLKNDRSGECSPEKECLRCHVNVISNSPQDCTHPDDRTLLNYDMTPGFKPFTSLFFNFHYLI